VYKSIAKLLAVCELEVIIIIIIIEEEEEEEERS
jgi:hypothetical protein